MAGSGTCGILDMPKGSRDERHGCRRASRENLDHRLTAIAQILPTLATKKDLEAFATKQDLHDGLDALRRHMQMLSEDLIERIKVPGESRLKRRR
jgi:hypothetical protein